MRRLGKAKRGATVEPIRTEPRAWVVPHAGRPAAVLGWPSVDRTRGPYRTRELSCRPARHAPVVRQEEVSHPDGSVWPLHPATPSRVSG